MPDLATRADLEVLLRDFYAEQRPGLTLVARRDPAPTVSCQSGGTSRRHA